MDSAVDTEKGTIIDPSTTQDPRLDPTSPQFDADLALQESNIQLPVPDAPVFDNISKCAVFVQSDSNQAKQQTSATCGAEAQAKKAKAAAFKQRAMQAARRAESSVMLGSLADIMSNVDVGPLAVLAKWHATGQQVYVVTRHGRGVRGRLVGQLVAFDKYINLLLKDVEESYTVIVKVQRIKQQAVPSPQGTSSTIQGHVHQQQQQQQAEQGQQSPPAYQPQLQQQQLEQQQHDQQDARQHQQQSCTAETPGARVRTRWCRKQQHRFRHLDQILLRGDSVVLVSSVPPNWQRQGIVHTSNAADAV